MRITGLLVVLASLLALIPGSALAFQPRTGNEVIVGSDEIVNDDLYASGGTIRIDGTVNGDLVATGGNITVAGTVAGDVMAAGGTILVPGTVKGTLRAAGGNLAVNGHIGEDILFGGGSLDLGTTGSTGRDLVVGTGSAAVGGQVGRNIQAGVGTLTLNGPVNGNAQVSGGTVHLGNGAVIGGDLTYVSETPAEIDPGARVRGQIVHRTPAEPQRQSPLEIALSYMLGWLRALVGLFALGLIFVLLFPSFTRQITLTLRESPWASLGLGFVLLIVVPILAIIIFVLGLILGGWWLALICLAIDGLLLALSMPLVGAFVGRLLFDRFGAPAANQIWALLAGLAIILLIGLIPIVGPIVLFVAVLFGLGAIALAFIRSRRAPPAIA